MTTLNASAGTGKADFHEVAASFLDQPGLPFTDILNAVNIEQIFAEHSALFATDAIYSTPLVLWAFLAQILAMRRSLMRSSSRSSWTAWLSWSLASGSRTRALMLLADQPLAQVMA